MSRSFLIAISLLCLGGLAASRLHSSPADTFATSAVSINPDEIQATIKGLPEQQFADLV
jgi:hypothetical protein